MVTPEEKTALFLIHSLAQAGSKGEIAWRGGNFLASTRIQLGPAIRAATELDLKADIRNIRSENPDYLNTINQPTICIFGKLSHPDKQYAKRIAIANLAAIPILKRKSIPIVISYSDNLATHEDSPIAELYRSLLWHADAVIYPCQAMAALGKAWYDKKNSPSEWIIEDPCQMQKAPFPHLSQQQPCKIIWFGHSSNASHLFKEIPLLAEQCDSWNSFELTILSDPETARKAQKIFLKCKAKRKWIFRFRQWDTSRQPEQLQKELERAHIAVIPSDPKNPRKSAASHNRAVDAISAGCMTIASPLQSYIELQKVLLLTHNFAASINQGIREYERLTDKWSRTRDEHLKRFSREENQQKWKKLFSKMITNP